MKNRVYILGGHQTDFAQNWSRSDRDLCDVFKDTVKNGLLKTNLEPSDIDVAHVGNFTFLQSGSFGWLFCIY